MPPSASRLRAAFVIHGLEPAAGGCADDVPPRDRPRVGHDGLRLVFAAFDPEQLEITVPGDQIPVCGEGVGDGDPGRALHRGIAARRFRRAIRLAPGLAGDERDRGLLSIRPACRPAERAARRIGIGPRNP